MQKRAPDSHAPQLSLTPGNHAPQRHETISVQSLKLCFEDWIDSGEGQQQAQRTLVEKRGVVVRFFWFLEQKGYTEVGVSELRRFFTYLTNGHLEPGGRWGNPQCTKPLRPVTVRGYYVYLQGLFGWIVADGFMSETPFTRLSPPIVRLDQPAVFSDDQVLALLAAAENSHHPARDCAILMLMLDTGLRVSEVCSLKVGSIDLDGRRLRVMGKGNKERSARLGRAAYKSLYRFIHSSGRAQHQFLFTSDRGITSGDPLTRSGMLKLFTRLAAAAGIQGKCSPHMLRRYFAVSFLKPLVDGERVLQPGGNVFALKEMLGHTTLTMTNRYVVLAQADFDSQHRQFSPGDRLNRLK